MSCYLKIISLHILCGLIEEDDGKLDDVYDILKYVATSF